MQNSGTETCCEDGKIILISCEMAKDPTCLTLVLPTLNLVVLLLEGWLVTWANGTDSRFLPYSLYCAVGTIMRPVYAALGGGLFQ